MNILIIGGNRFFGKRLAADLLEEGHEVTLLNRGNQDDGFGQKLNRIQCDRNNRNDLSAAVDGRKWDIIYDQVCFDYATAKNACEIFSGKTQKYIFTSTQSVYGPGKNLAETDYQPALHKFEKIQTMKSDYGEAKRQAEVAFHQFANFPVVSVRFPIVIGNDDYSGRFKFHIDRIKSREPIYYPNIDANISFVSAAFAAQTLKYFTRSLFSGSLNVASPSPITLREFTSIIERKMGMKAVLATAPTPANHSPYGIEVDRYLDCSKLSKECGIEGSEISEWLPMLDWELI